MSSRRKFIYQIGSIAGVSMLPGCASLVTNPKKKGVTVRVIFSYKGGVVQDVPNWPGLGHDFRPEIENMMNALNINIPDVNFIESRGIWQPETAAEIVQNDGDDVAGYIVVQMNNWNMTINGVLPSKKPILFYPCPYEGDGGWLSRTTGILWSNHPHYAFIASFNFMDVIKAASAFSKLNSGTADDFDVESERIRKEIIPTECKAVAKEDDLKCLSAQETLERIKGTRIIALGAELTDYAKEIKRVFGMDVIFINFDEFNRLFDTIKDSEAKSQADKWKNGASNVYHSTDNEIFLAAKTYLTAKEFIKKYDAKAITIDCLGGFSKGDLKGYPCLGFMQLQNDGLMGVCEEDLSSTSTMLVFGQMTGRIGYVSDPVLDFSTRSVSYAHCVCTTKLFGPEGPDSPYSIITHCTDRKGSSVRAVAPIGYPVTTVMFDLRFKEMTVHTGIITGNSSDDRGCRTKIIAEVKGDYDKIFRHWQCWHRCTFIGDFAKEAEEIANLIGYTIIREC